MKTVLYILFTLLIVGCSSKSETFKQLNANKNSYSKLQMTKIKLLKNTIVYITYNKQSKNYIVEIISRDREAEVTLDKCLFNKKEAIIEPINNENYEWQDSYLLYSLKSTTNSVKLDCTLTNGDKFSTTF